jgi:hypothetical protein
MGCTMQGRLGVLVVVLAVAMIGCHSASESGMDAGEGVRCTAGLSPSDTVYCPIGSQCCADEHLQAGAAFCCPAGTQCCEVWSVSYQAGFELRSTCFAGDTPCPVFCQNDPTGPTCPNGQLCLNTGGCTSSCPADWCHPACCDVGYYCNLGGSGFHSYCAMIPDAGVCCQHDAAPADGPG